MAKILPTWPSGTSLADRAMEGERWQVLGCLYLSTYTFEVKTLGWEIESVKRQPLLHRKKSLLIMMFVVFASAAFHDTLQPIQRPKHCYAAVKKSFVSRQAVLLL
jgi:hypothetical protein